MSSQAITRQASTTQAVNRQATSQPTAPEPELLRLLDELSTEEAFDLVDQLAALEAERRWGALQGSETGWSCRA